MSQEALRHGYNTNRTMQIHWNIKKFEYYFLQLLAHLTWILYAENCFRQSLPCDILRWAVFFNVLIRFIFSSASQAYIITTFNHRIQLYNQIIFITFSNRNMNVIQTFFFYLKILGCTNNNLKLLSIHIFNLNLSF